MERAFKSELDGMTAALKEQLRRRPDRVPSIDRILSVARDLIETALTTGVFGRGESPAFQFGDDRTFWVDGWPGGEWVSRSEVFSDETGDDLIALRIFDPNVIESIIWFVKTVDRRKHDAMEDAGRRRSASQDERDQVEAPLASHLQFIGHTVRRQVKCSGGRIDILDLTANEIIECKISGSASNIVAAVLQLRRYADQFSGAQLAVAVPAVNLDAVWLADILPHTGIRVIEVLKLRGPLQ